MMPTLQLLVKRGKVAEKTFDDIVMVTLGTGVGGGVILEGKILTGHNGAAGEIGHMHVEDSEETEL